MIPGGAVMVAGALFILGACLVAAGLLLWWLWRQYCAYRGRPRPPLHGGVLALVMLVSVYPIFVGVTLAGSYIHDIQQARYDLFWKKRRFFVLREAQQLGEIRVPAGSLINREDPREPGTDEDSPIPLTTVTAVRLAQPQRIAGVLANAFEVSPTVIELAEPYVFAREDGSEESCKAGWLATFTPPPDLLAIFQAWPPDWSPDTFQPSRWQFQDCFESDHPIWLLMLDGEQERVVEGLDDVPMPGSVGEHR